MSKKTTTGDAAGLANALAAGLTPNTGLDDLKTETAKAAEALDAAVIAEGLQNAGDTVTTFAPDAEETDCLKIEHIDADHPDANGGFIRLSSIFAIDISVAAIRENGTEPEQVAEVIAALLVERIKQDLELDAVPQLVTFFKEHKTLEPKED